MHKAYTRVSADLAARQYIRLSQDPWTPAFAGMTKGATQINRAIACPC